MEIVAATTDLPRSRLNLDGETAAGEIEMHRRLLKRDRRDRRDRAAAASDGEGTGMEEMEERNRARLLRMLSNNFFEGKIPCGIISTLNLSFNLLSGLLPSCLNLENARHLLLRGNNLTGSLPKAFLNSPYIVTFDIRDNSFSGNIPKEIGRLSNLRVLLLSGNQFSGMIPKQLCWLKKIGIMDLSRNFFSGTIPYCFYNITFGKLAANEFVYVMDSFGWVPDFSHPYKSLLNKDSQIEGTSFYFHILIEIEFLTKYRSNLYQGLIHDMMSTLDLSFNKLTGEIPPDLGQLSSIFALNLSHNQLNGPIPKTFSNLTQLESLDLSLNNLSGEIPLVLTDLTFLAVFTVAHNNLSGKVPDMKKQFSTFGESSYEGNSFLCGAPLKKSCTVIDESPPSPQKSSEASHGKWYEVDLLAFFTSFLASCIIFFLGVVSVLYINPHWRKRCFNLVEDRMYLCYYFALNTLKGLTSRMRH
ncbi:hypothetical protein SO802_005242 [Lithocarpus litseifolius]|uniref:Uncharacterized protein n=1 Tax=Lithocarpus litseifolius TaxID=425828 RepID=A0AAW2DKU8_9ROSI